MLTVTETAASMIRTLTRRAELPQDAGLRFSRDPRRHSLAMTLAPAPEQQDAVVVQRGVRVFVAPDAAERLFNQTLDADRSGQNQRFFLNS
jgi:Fe-S cluster assembly iron-binding protein IscA